MGRMGACLSFGAVGMRSGEADGAKCRRTMVQM